MSANDQLVGDVVNEVLETMFFSTVFGPGAETEGLRVTARVAFSGQHDGALEVSALDDTVSKLACSFLGVAEEEIPDGQAPAMLGEMANVLCGVMLGRLEPEGRFQIAPPAIEKSAIIGARPPAADQTFEVAEGWLTVGWRMN